MVPGFSQNVAIVVIGGNEGARLKGCLRAAMDVARTVVYVDSGSGDKSAQYAQSVGCIVVQLDPVEPFSVARARKEGCACVMEHEPDVDLIQFVDCESNLVDGRLQRGVAAPMPVASAALSADPAPHTIHGQFFVPTEPSPIPPRTSKTLQPPKPVRPSPNPVSADPWLAQVPRQLNAPRAPKFPESLFLREPSPVGVAPLPIARRPDPISGPRFDFALTSAQPVAPPVQVWEPAPPFSPAVDSRAAPGRTKAADTKISASEVTSRVDRLRDIVSVLGLREMHKTEAPREPALKSAPKADRFEERAVFDRALVPALVSESMVSASPELATAKAEFPPLKPIVYTLPAEASAESAASDRPGRRAGDEGVRILPSRRGQYERR